MRARITTAGALVLAVLAAACSSGSGSETQPPTSVEKASTTIDDPTDWYDYCGVVTTATAEVGPLGDLATASDRTADVRDVVADLIDAAPAEVADPLDELRLALTTTVEPGRPAVVAMATAAARGNLDIGVLTEIDEATADNCGDELFGLAPAAVRQATTPYQVGSGVAFDPTNVLGRRLCTDGSGEVLPIRDGHFAVRCTDPGPRLYLVDLTVPEVGSPVETPAWASHTVVALDHDRIYSITSTETPASGLTPASFTWELTATTISTGAIAFTHEIAPAVGAAPVIDIDDAPEIDVTLSPAGEHVIVSGMWADERYQDGYPARSVALDVDGNVVWDHPRRIVGTLGPWLEGHRTEGDRGAYVVDAASGAELAPFSQLGDGEVTMFRSNACSRLVVVRDYGSDVGVLDPSAGLTVFRFAGDDVGYFKDVASDGTLRFKNNTWLFHGVDGQLLWSHPLDIVNDAYTWGGHLVLVNDADEHLIVDQATGEVAETLDVEPSDDDLVFSDGVLRHEDGVWTFIGRDMACDGAPAWRTGTDTGS